MNDLRRSEILRTARSVVKEHGFTKFPVDPKVIAERKGITIHPFDATSLGISGCLMMTGNDFGIGYSTAIKNAGFENFTIAHELGHYFLDGHTDALLASGRHFSKSGYLSSDIFEKEADLFASELLLPEFLLRPAIDRGGSGFRLIQRLAQDAQTSLVATAIRYAKLADDPVAVVLSNGQDVSWAFLSCSIKECPGVYQLPKGSLLPTESATSAFNQDIENIISGKQIEDLSTLRTWFERAVDTEIKEDVIGLGHYGKTLTILFTQEALIQSDEENEDESEGADTHLPSARWARRDRDRHA